MSEDRRVEELLAQHELVERELSFLKDKDGRLRALLDEAGYRTKPVEPIRVQTLAEYRIIREGQRVEELTTRQFEDSLKDVGKSISELEGKRERIARALHLAGMPEEVFVAHPTRPGRFVFLQKTSPANAPRLHVVPEGAIGLCEDPSGEHYIEEVLRHARRLERFAGLKGSRKLFSWGWTVLFSLLALLLAVVVLGSLVAPALVVFFVLPIPETIAKYVMAVMASIPMVVFIAVLGPHMLDDVWDEDMRRSWRLMRRPPGGLRRSDIPPPGWKENA